MVLLAACTRAVFPVAVLVAALWVSLVCLPRRGGVSSQQGGLARTGSVRCLWLWVAHWCLVPALRWCCVLAAALLSARRVRTR